MISIRRIQPDDVTTIKALADADRESLGFSPRKKFEEVASQQRSFTAVCNAEVIGFVIFRHRKADLQTTLSEISVREDFRHQRIGEKLINELIKECIEMSREFIQLKCPVDLPANQFYRRLGFVLHTTELGRKRNLNVWRFVIPRKPTNEI